MLQIIATMAIQGATLAPSPPPAVRAVAPPPVIVPVMPPPPVVSSAELPNVMDRPAVMVRFRVTAGNMVLFDDRMRVGRAGASYSQNRNEAPEIECGPNAFYSARQMLNVNLRPEGPTRDNYRISVNWNRPVGTCSSAGNRGVSLDQAIELKPGRPVAVDGDGGLRVELTRP